ncbi:hypothetical protein [Luteipulveratus mongoliensis]|uniref:NHLP leader peptide family natural product n=1 Tax=Luteipulveratus mongoliensis TaxID=571913 RepID=A0A0K1JG72_9MICO|nr:hypothetical protein [Luteipulveratus mongoliensis]AKU15598.1 hypothetical protein VV02_06575 [Luteipulveratus mongoliensis]
MALSEQARADFVGAYTRTLIAAWSNEEFAAKLESDPRPALAENGIELPADAKIKVDRSDPSDGHQGTLDTQVALFEEGQKTGVYEFHIPTSPQVDMAELNEDELAGVAGGDFYCCPCCCCT